ncbi:NAD(P)/FAD-dependent oxidoreductase [Sabulicella glaciei]|uniref:FAD-dependent oxidoreductase n=1 Tax=Sabulicella glaciei TaxID=2984948 RepID=A0ABT3NUM6_9PROT|nr:FAD-dependent oxidoreductase [Roseococcus sp. MDT2-1-1]MCW8085862.1 FAD-dependent oxidoreductase [Roseococcus sp. MDT2-1-1]
MTRTALVLGAGIMGLSAAWGLHREGFAVSVVEQDAVPNPRGSSVDDHRLIRHAYGAQRGYMRMVDEAYEAWDALWRDLGTVLHVPTGVLALDEGGGDWLRDSRAALREAGHAVQDLAAGSVEARFPLLRGAGIADAFHMEAGGVLLAQRIVAAFAAHLRANGVAFRQARVREVGEALTLEDGTRLAADALVVAAGPWASRLLPALRGRVTPSAQVIVRLRPPDAGWSRMPMILDLSPAGGFYLVPPVAGTPLKIGDHSFSLQGDPDDPDRTPDRREVERILSLAARRVHGIEDWAREGEAVCFYDVEPREAFILEPLGRRAFVMCGFSGHGFKFGPVLGLRLAATLAGREETAALSRWAAGRESVAA